MARVKRSVNAKKKRREVLERHKGYRGIKKNTYRHAKEQVMRSLSYQYRDRRPASVTSGGCGSSASTRRRARTGCRTTS